MRSDKGGENIEVARAMISVRGTGTKRVAASTTRGSRGYRGTHFTVLDSYTMPYSKTVVSLMEIVKKICLLSITCFCQG